jgi:hypothetical protein
LTDSARERSRTASGDGRPGDRLHCPCGKPANTVHLIDPSFDREPWAAGEDGPNTYPRASSVAVPCCPDHDLGVSFVSVGDLAERWSFWLDHYGGKVWRGDEALGRLATGL